MKRHTTQKPSRGSLTLSLLLLSSLLFGSSVALAETHEVGQKDKQFSVESLNIKVGDSVAFKNNDPFYHNVFSLSDAALFDLGSYPQGESKTVTFEEKGTVEVECAIHPSMVMEIIVE